MTKKTLKWTAPLILIILLTPFSKDIDLYLSGLFYNSHSLSHRPFSHHPFIFLIYKTGFVPAFLFGITSLFFLILSYIKKSYYCYRTPSFFLLASVLLGTFFIVNVFFKGLWQRPRPVQTEEFGGFAPYHSFYQRLTQKTPEPCRSFPSGHTSSGFCFFCLAILGKRLNKRALIIAGYSLCAFLGGSMAFARIAQGGHYFTDIFFSAVITWYVTLILDYYLFERSYGKRIDQETTRNF